MSDNIIKMSPIRKGDLAEWRSAALFVEEGFEVFKNVNRDGPADIVRWDTKTNTFTPIDVKMRRSKAGFLRTAKQVKLDVHIVEYNTEKNSNRFIIHDKGAGRKKISVIINGKIYESITAASKTENIAYSTLWKRLKRGDEGYEYA